MKALTLCMEAREKLKELPKIVGVPSPRIALVKRVTTLISAPWSCWPPQDFLPGRQRKSRGSSGIGRMHTHSNRNRTSCAASGPTMFTLYVNHSSSFPRHCENNSSSSRSRSSSRSSTSGSHRMRMRRRWSTVRDRRGRCKSFLCQRHQR